MKLIGDKLCTGCGACVNACPHDAILMNPDPEGFLQPRINKEKCIGCGKCKRICPLPRIETLIPRQIDKSPLCGCTLDETIWRESSSGGAFSEVCEVMRGEKPVVFGARFSGADSIVHDSVSSVDDIGIFRKSKYVQSDVGMTFRACRQLLFDGKYVIYSGTPCQLAGLRSYLGRDFEKLLLVEFICHGVGSPAVFRESLRWMSKKLHGNVQQYEFRSKREVPVFDGHVSFYRFDNGKTLSIHCDLYNRFFLNQLCLRRSCMENCRFRRSERIADITLGDSRGEEKIYPDKGDKKWSVIVANTAKGERVVEMLASRMDVRPYPLALLEKTNPLYFRTTPGNPRRDEFFSLFRGGQNLFRLSQKFVPDQNTVSLRLFRLIKRILRKTGVAPCLRWMIRFVRRQSR